MVKNFSLIAYWFGTTKIHPMQLMIYFYFMQKGKKKSLSLHEKKSIYGFKIYI